MCTWFKFDNDRGHAFTGRTFEAPGEYGGYVTVVPRGARVAGSVATYGFVAMENFGTDDELGLYFDAFNEHGLSVVCNALEDADYGEGERDPAAIVVTDAVAHVAMSCTTVDEAVAFFRSNRFRSGGAAECENADYDQYHWAVTERSGRSVVVEIVDGGDVRIYDNDVGVMTNEPTFDAQLALTNALDPAGFDEELFHPFDMSCEGRFGKMAALNARQLEPIRTDLDAVNRAWQMVNVLDIPAGALYWREVSHEPQIVSWATVVDLQNRVYYFRTHDNMDVRRIDLTTVDFDAGEILRDRLFGSCDYKAYVFRGSEGVTRVA